jgi:hypothetical protein
MPTRLNEQFSDLWQKHTGKGFDDIYKEVLSADEE